MKIAFLVTALDRLDDAERSVIAQSYQLAIRHDLEILSVFRWPHVPAVPVHPKVRTRYLVERGADPQMVEPVPHGPSPPSELHRARSVLIPISWDTGFTALSDVAIEHALRRLRANVVVTSSPALLSLAAQFVGSDVAIVHQEHLIFPQRPAGLGALQAFAPRADLIGVLNEATATWLRARLGAAAPPIEAIPNPLSAGFRPRSLLNANVIMAAGRLTADRQFDHLVRAFALLKEALPDWRLRIVGDGPERNALQLLVRDLELFDCIELPGRIVDLGSEWAKASIGALTSRVEVLPLVVQEAMAAGVPVVSYDCPSGPRELVRHEETGLLVPPNSVEAMAAALLRLAQDVELRATLGQAAAAFAQQFDASVIVDKWEGLLSDVVTRTQASKSRSRILRRVGGSTTARISLDREARQSELAPSPASYADEPARPIGARPADARRRALESAVSAARQIAMPWFVIPPVGVRAPVVVIPESERSRYLELLGRGAPSHLGLSHGGGAGWPAVSGPVADMTAYLRRGAPTHVSIQDPAAGELNTAGRRRGGEVDIEFWRITDDELVAPRPNGFTTRVPLSPALVDLEVDEVVVSTLPLMAQLTAFDRPFPVDAVFTWVDGSDPCWIARRDRRLAEVADPRSDLDERAIGAWRYASRDELKYALRSVHLFAPWIRHIYLVTDQQVPSWLDTAHSMVTVVDHADILDREHLPTFNSHAIETGLHRIQGLGEHFIYFNDDTFLGRSAAKELFFSPSGLMATFFSRETIGLDRPGAPPHIRAALNNRHLLERDFGRTITNCLLHTPHPLQRSAIEEIEKRYEAEFRRTAGAPFRWATDVSALSSLTQHYSLLTGRAYIGEISSTHISLGAPDLRRKLRTALDGPACDSFCLADTYKRVLPDEIVAQEAETFLRQYFPVSAPWEYPESTT